ncbi:MAG: hypothetical protein WCL02_07545 [bacterium]
MKKKYIWELVIFITANIVLAMTGFWGSYTEKIELFDWIIIISIQSLFLAFSFFILIITREVIDETISISMTEIIGTVIGKVKKDDHDSMLNPMINNPSMLIPIFNDHDFYSISIRTKEGMTYLCKCNEREFTSAKNGDILVCIEDIRKSGSIYYYTK